MVDSNRTGIRGVYNDSTEISVKFTVSMHRLSILLFKVPYVTSVLVIRSCYASGGILESSPKG